VVFSFTQNVGRRTTLSMFLKGRRSDEHVVQTANVSDLSCGFFFQAKREAAYDTVDVLERKTFG
jgi:hypothetical protein